MHLDTVTLTANRHVQQSQLQPLNYLKGDQVINSLLNDTVLYPITIWSICSMLYFLIKWLAFIANPPSKFSYNSVELRIDLVTHIAVRFCDQGLIGFAK